MAKVFIEESTLSAIGDSIRAKTGKTDMISPQNMPTEIASIQAGSGSGPSSPVSSNDVTFYDYNGTVIASYSLEEAQALTALPDGPTHEGLTFQGWNYTLEKVKAFTRSMNVGAMYITNDGKTRLYIHIADKSRSTVPLYISQTVANGVTIDWGDGSTTETLAGTGNVSTFHTYSEAGDFTISLTVADGCILGFETDSPSYSIMGANDKSGKVYCNMLQKVEIGSGVTSIGANTFNNCYSLSSITIPDGVTNIGDYAFSNCRSLSSITIPDGVTNIGDYAFSNCRSLSSIIIPDGVTNIGDYAFLYCYSLSSIIIPDGVTNIVSNMFNSCYSLSSIIIPDGVTSIGDYAFSGCYALPSIIIPDGVTSIGGSAFSSCSSLSNITIPDGVTSIGSRAFQQCTSLSSIIIPDGVTNIVSNMFNGCCSLSSIIIPDGVTSIGSYAFSDCYGVAEYHLKPTTPPTLLNTNAFKNIPSDCIIYVPQGSLEAYQTESNWGTYTNHMQEETA